MGKARRLVENWVEVTDEKSGKVYYANTKTKETRWDMPDVVKQFQAEQAKKKNEELTKNNSSSGAGSGSGSGAGGASNKDNVWVERTDAKTGRIYYYNKALKQTSWTRPEDTITAASTDPNYGKGCWVARVDPRTNRTYYYNTVTKLTSWVNPDEEQQKPSPAKKAPSMASRISKRISFSPKAEEEPAYEAAPMAPTNRTSARASIRLGAMPTPGQNNRLSMAGRARELEREKKIALAQQAGLDQQDGGVDGLAEEDEEPKAEAFGDRFAKLRALKNRAAAAQPSDMIEKEEEQQHIDLNDLAQTAVAEAAALDFKMEQYASEYLQLKRKGFTKKPTTIDKLLSHKTEKIRGPLHPLTEPALVHDAILAYQNILCYCGDKSSKNPLNNANKIFRIVVGAPEELHDEVYVQLIKQTNRNPDPTSCQRAWELLASCCGLFPPSNKLEKYLLSYLRQSIEQPPYPGIGKMGEYCLVRLQRTMELGPRKEAPTEIELESVRNVKPVTVRVHLLDGTILPMQSESWTTVDDLLGHIGKQLKINDISPFGLYEVSNLDEERALEDDDRILDVISYWDREKKAAKKARDAPSFQFVYKVRLFFDIKEDDEAAVEVAFHQAVHDVTDSRYPCSEEDAFRLAALQAQEKFGDYDGSDVFGNELQAFLPAKFYHRDVEREIKEAITETYKLLRGYDILEARNNYLDYVKAWKIYGSAYFFVEPQNSREFPPDVVLAVNAKGVLVVDPQTKEFLADYPYSELVTWGHSSITFVLVVGNLIRQNKLYFKTDQGQEMNSLIHAYVNRLVDE